MTEKAIPRTVTPLRPDAQSSPRNLEYGARPAKRSFLNHPALLIVLLVGCLALALPYVIALTPPVRLASVVGTAVSPVPDSGDPDVGTVVDAPAAAEQPPAAEDPLQVVQSSFDPVLLERLEKDRPATVAEMIIGTEDAPVVTTEKLRILAQMTPEQIDALTFLLLSQQDPKAAAAATDQTNAIADDAPWVGDWTSEDLIAESADPDIGIESVQNDLLTGWYVFEASVDEALIRHIDDPLSAVRVYPGTVLGNLGSVSEIRIEAGRAKVVLSGGDVILSDDSAIILRGDVTDSPESTEPRRGPPFEVALSTAQIELPVVPAGGAVASDDATKDMVEPVLASPSVVTPQTTSTQSASEQPAAQSGSDAGRYVQVATFKSAANAQTAKDMVVSGGMTGQLRTTTQQGASYHLVLAGPFDPAEIQTALTRVTRLGFRDAFIIR
jgi:hypothetical protein